MTTRELALTLALALTVGCAAQPDDEKIVRTLDQSLGADANLLEVDAASSKGEVTLSGTVASELDRSRAEQIAQAVEGVVKVNNRLTVAAPAELPPVASPPPIESAPEGPSDGSMMDGAPTGTGSDTGSETEDAPSGS